MDWMMENWTLCLSIFWMLEKIVKLTPMKADDILLDIIWGGIKRALKK